MSSFWTPLSLATLLLSSALLASAPEVPPGATVQDRENLREFFVLTDPGSDDPVGVMALRRTVGVGGVLLEQDLCFSDGVRVFESERWRGAGRRFIWREWGHPSRPGRTWILEGERGAIRLNLLSWTGGPVQRLNLSVSDGTLFPLEALERLRRTKAASTRLELVSPLLACVESVTLTCERVEADPEKATGPYRVLCMINGRGEDMGQWILAGNRLIEQRWPSGRRARIVDETRYHALFADWSDSSDG
jgi:hypothetical protein